MLENVSAGEPWGRLLHYSGRQIVEVAKGPGRVSLRIIKGTHFGTPQRIDIDLHQCTFNSSVVTQSLNCASDCTLACSLDLPT